MYKALQRILNIGSDKQIKRFVLNSLLFVFIIYIYNLLRISKDAISLSATKGSVISTYLKSFVVLPATFIVTIFYSSLRTKFNRVQIFNIFIVGFLIFFAVYGFYLGPNASTLHIPLEKAKLTAQYISVKLDFKFFKLGTLIANLYLNVVVYWTVSLFYVMSELWGSCALNLLLWSFINQTTTRRHSTNTFLLYTVVSNVASIIVGIMANSGRGTNWNSTFKIYTVSIIVAMIMIMILYYYSDLNAVSDHELNRIIAITKGNTKTGGLWASLKVVHASPALICITIISICYGACMILVETHFKNSIGKFTNFDQKLIFDINGNLVLIQGLLSLFVSLFLYKKFTSAKWFTLAKVTPLALMIFGGLYFLLALIPSFPTYMSKVLGLNKFNMINSIEQGSTLLVLIAGSIQTILCKGVKYALFDVTKEKVYIALSEEEKTIGKASVDMLSDKLGKGAGSILMSTILIPIISGSVLLESFQKIDNIANIIAIIYMITSLVFYFAIIRLAKIYEDNEIIMDNKEDLDSNKNLYLENKVPNVIDVQKK